MRIPVVTFYRFEKQCTKIKCNFFPSIYFKVLPSCHPDVGAVGTVALQQKGLGFESQPAVFLHDISLFSLCICRFSPGTPASSNSPKT